PRTFVTIPVSPSEVDSTFTFSMDRAVSLPIASMAKSEFTPFVKTCVYTCFKLLGIYLVVSRAERFIYLSCHIKRTPEAVSSPDSLKLALIVVTEAERQMPV